jgi:hypothetical protein
VAHGPRAATGHRTKALRASLRQANASGESAGA